MAGFPTTPWDEVTRARHLRERQRRAGLEYLCRTYRPSLVTTLLAWGYSMADAEDLVQGFLLYFIRTEAVCKADPAKGRFRNFLLGVLKHYLSTERTRAARQKRGGSIRFVSLEAAPPGLALDAGHLPEHFPQCDRDWRRILPAAPRNGCRVNTKTSEADAGPFGILLRI